MSHSTIADSHFGVYATDYNFTSNSSLVNFHSHPTPSSLDLPDGQMASLDYDLAHAYPGCQGYFEWEGEVKTAKHSCWGCGAQDEYRYWVEPIVEGTNAGGHMCQGHSHPSAPSVKDILLPAAWVACQWQLR